jgi:glutamyl-tRNA synthetase
VDTTVERATNAAALLKERATFPADMLEGIYLFTTGSPLKGNAEAEAELKKRWKPEAAPAIEAYITAIEAAQATAAPQFEKAFNAVLVEKGMKIGQVMPLYRLFVAGRMQGPGMFDVSALLGREELIARLRAGLEHCGAWA